ncbi:peptidylprolyl isomerase SurA [Alkalimonas delamerensis]|uniref:Chaperone SurA n=1 Tax=Alkalimonas delamerensis TaxID=265981 RepID=A0ABT9GKZ0_9GAMM|nr:peptidylprolyl isomerase SurA [Alkalimonas delamerensis]MDP4527638.1 peptidylprolyl isomerase SurA [Alkalimonas delamerensis]
MRLLSCILLAGCLLCWQQAAANEREIDRIAAVVDTGVVLESEVREIVDRVKRNAAAQGQGLPSDQVLRVQALERLIQTSLQMQMANRMGLQISDAQLDQTIQRIASSENMTLDQFRLQVEQEEGSYQQFRERLREEITTNEVMRNAVQRRIYISPQEVESLLRVMQEQGASSEQYNVGHILIGLPSQASTEDIERARNQADRVLQLLRDGADFRQQAITSSSGSQALEGGDMGWMNINEMPTLFAEAIRGKRRGDLIGPLRSGAGFHILTIFDIRGENVAELLEVKSRHVLIRPSIILSEERARDRLARFVNDFRNGEADFAEFAREHSEDPGSRNAGGELGWAEPEMYVPEFRDTLLSLELNEISEPFRTEHGWHVVQLLERRTVDATADRQREQIYRMIFNRRFNEESANFLRELRDEAYIEVMD